ncbi:MAG: DNA-directed RNA polymerase subunit alpha C-terminal domain-containing protein, partial [Patescibacteria group bacterium]
LNLKGLSFRLLDGKDQATVRLSVKGAKEIKASDLDIPEGVEVVNKDHYIATVSDKKGKLDMDLNIEKGYGYSLSEERRGSTLGVIPTDAVFSPVKRVSYDISATRVGRQTNLDKLTINIWTNGVITPKEALDEAARNVASYFTQIYEPKKAEEPEVSSTPSIPDAVLNLTIDELDLPTRIYNSLRNGGIETLGDLLKTPRKDLIAMRNMGGKSISVIEEKLKEREIELPA